MFATSSAIWRPIRCPMLIHREETDRNLNRKCAFDADDRQSPPPVCLNDVLPAFRDSKAEEVDAISEKLRIILKVGSLSAGFSRLASLAPLHRPDFVSPMSYGLAFRCWATIRDTVGWLMLYRRHLGPGFAAGDDALGDLAALASSFLRRPPTRPSARAAARPAEVRSRIMARSNSAKEPGKIQGILFVWASECARNPASNSMGLRRNSLRIGTGNLFRPSRELNRAIREVIRLIRESCAGRHFTAK